MKADLPFASRAIHGAAVCVCALVAPLSPSPGIAAPVGLKLAHLSPPASDTFRTGGKPSVDPSPPGFHFGAPVARHRELRVLAKSRVAKLRSIEEAAT